MTAILENHKEAIAELCRKYSVQRLFAFGSAIRSSLKNPPTPAKMGQPPIP